MNKKVIALATILGISATSLIDILTGEAKDNLEFLKRYLGFNEEYVTSLSPNNKTNYKANYTIIGIHKETKDVLKIILGLPYSEYLENIEKTGYNKLETDFLEYDLYPLNNLQSYLPDILEKDSYSPKELQIIINKLLSQSEEKVLLKD